MDYDPIYSKKDFYWGKDPHPIVVKSIQYFPSNSKVLDLGCGDGKDSFFLAKKKFDVTAIDISKEGIKKLNKFAEEKNLKIKTKVSDIKDFLKTSKPFDVIVAVNSVQFVDKENISSVIENIKSKTTKNGINVICSFIAETPEQKNKWLSSNRYLFEEEELRKFYSDWEIIFYEEKMGEWETHGEPRHRHYLVHIIARKL